MMQIGFIKYITFLVLFVPLNAQSNIDLPNKSIELIKLENIAKDGDVESQFILGSIYMHGFKLSGNWVSKDYTKAYYWTKQAANNHHYKAMHNLGVLYRDGKGVSKDTTKARYWFGKASQNGLIRSSWSLIALNLDEGKPVTDIVNYSEAVTFGKDIAIKNYNKKHYALALGDLLNLSKLGDVESRFLIAHIYLIENKSTKHTNKAIEILKELADKRNDIDSLLILGQIYEEGQFANKNTSVSNGYYKKAFIILNSMSTLNSDQLYNLALIYENGLGVEKNIPKAIEAYKQAANKGDIDSERELRRLSSTNNEINKKSNKKINKDNLLSGQNSPTE